MLGKRYKMKKVAAYVRMAFVRMSDVRLTDVRRMR